MTERQTQTQEIQVNDSIQRRRFANTVFTLAQQFYQLVLVDNPGSLPVISNSVLKSVPVLDFVTEGDLTLAQGLNGRILKAESLDGTSIGAKVVDRINALPMEQVRSGQVALDQLIDIASVISFSTARRIKSFLPVALPDTHEGLRVLREISANVREKIPATNRRENLAGNLSTLGQTLRLLEDELITKTMEDSQAVSNLLDLARSEARVQLLEAGRRDDIDRITGLRDEIVQGKMTKLKEIKVIEVVDGEEREFSELDRQLYRIIEEERLEDRLPDAKVQLEQNIEQRKAEAVEIIVRRRSIRKIAGQMLSDQKLRSIAAKISRLTEEEILVLKDDDGLKIRSNIAGRLIDAPKGKLMRLGFTTFPNFREVFEEEQKKLTQALESGDPFLFASQLTVEEFELIKKRIPNIFRKRTSAENRALFALAKEQLQKKLAAGITPEELIEFVAEKLFLTLLRKFSQEMIDRALYSLITDPQILIDNPYILLDRVNEIIAIAQENLKASRLQSISPPEQVSQEKADQVPEANLPRFSPLIAQMPRSEELEQAFEWSVASPDKKILDPIALREDISSVDGPFRYFPDYQTQYPEVVTQALANLYDEYNRAFGPLVDANREWPTDYQYCLTGPGGSPVNYFVQIDMVGLPDGYLKTASTLDVSQVQEDLKGRIFEIENSLAMYQLLMKNFSRDGQPSHFDLRFRQSLEQLRRLHNKPIALLAVTKEKYHLMKGSEFGRLDGDPLTDGEVRSMSGFDKFFGPDEFVDYLGQNGGECDYLLYVRSSDPVAKLRNPNLAVKQPLLTDPSLRRIIKANAITFNIDSPNLQLGSPKRINDTKAYLLPMGMAYPVYTFRDFKSPQLAEFLKSRGVDATHIESGQAVIRAKPMQCSYGCYGHLRGKLAEGEFRQRLIRELRRRGPYVIQPEIKNASIINDFDGNEYTYIDRNFFSFIAGIPLFLGGERTLMLANSSEVTRGRIHGNVSSVTAEVI